MTDIKLLRMAARRIRDLASSVEQGTWVAETNDRGHAWVNLPAYPHAWGMHGFVDEAKHVAPFASPAVALAVADWLDAEADLHGAVDRADGKVPEGWVLRVTSSTLPQAVAVARAYLGSPE